MLYIKSLPPIFAETFEPHTLPDVSSHNVVGFIDGWRPPDTPNSEAVKKITPLSYATIYERFVRECITTFQTYNEHFELLEAQVKIYDEEGAADSIEAKSLRTSSGLTHREIQEWYRRTLQQYITLLHKLVTAKKFIGQTINHEILELIGTHNNYLEELRSKLSILGAPPNSLLNLLEDLFPSATDSAQQG